MRSTLYTWLTVFFAALLAIACKKSSPSFFGDGPNIFIAGTLHGNAVYWKNGEPVTLASNATAHCVAVSGQDVYVGGAVFGPVGAGINAVYWKNGMQVNLSTDRGSMVYGIAVSGTDVYAVGSIGATDNRAAYWKNGELVTLETGMFSEAYGVALSGDDVHIVGFIRGRDQLDSAAHWWDGARPDFYATASLAAVKAIAILGTEVYAAGLVNEQAYVWKNGLPVKLPGDNTVALAIALKGNDVYASGTIHRSIRHLEAVYWKNSSMVILTDKYVYAAANGLAFSGDDFYVAGTIFREREIPVCWKNGRMLELVDDGNANGIAVQQ